MSKQQYKISVIEFTGEGDSLKARSLYEQTVDAMDLKAVIAAVNLPTETFLLPHAPVAEPKRKLRSDKGKKHQRTKVTRTPTAIIQETTFNIDPNRPVEEQFEEIAEKHLREIPQEELGR